jgi:hypothetical protein
MNTASKRHTESHAHIAERLLAHARLCEQIAEQTWSEATALKLGELADECRRAAAELLPPRHRAH